MKHTAAGGVVQPRSRQLPLPPPQAPYSRRTSYSILALLTNLSPVSTSTVFLEHKIFKESSVLDELEKDQAHM